MDLTNLLSANGIMAASIFVSAGAYVMNRMRSVPGKIFKYLQKKLVYTVKIYQENPLFDAMEEYLYTKYRKQYKFVEAKIVFEDVKDGPTQAKNLEGGKRIVYLQEENTFIARVGGKRIMIGKNKQKLDNIMATKDIFMRHYAISGWRASVQINQFLVEVAEAYYTARDSGMVGIYGGMEYGEWYKSNDIVPKSIDNVVLEPGVKEELLQDIEKFIATKTWYEKRGIPYRRGYLFYGPPGNGKTSIALALAQHIKKDVYAPALNSYSDDAKMVKAFSSISPNSIILIEDADKTFAGRESVGETKISFSGFLNCIDGAMYKQGTIVIITTNHLEKLDPALIRTGRMDRRFCLGNPTPDMISKYLAHFYEQERIKADLSGLDVSMSTIQEVCLRHPHSIDDCLRELGAKRLKIA